MIAFTKPFTPFPQALTVYPEKNGLQQSDSSFQFCIIFWNRAVLQSSHLPTLFRNQFCQTLPNSLTLFSNAFLQPLLIARLKCSFSMGRYSHEYESQVKCHEHRSPHNTALQIHHFHMQIDAENIFNAKRRRRDFARILCYEIF